MKLSRRFRLGVSQSLMDFVDINPTRDTPLFVDPYFLAIRSDNFSQNASRTIRSFFQSFIGLVNAGEQQLARDMFDHFHEPNETCLGLSSGRPKGLAIGDIDADRLFESVVQSRAVQTGVVEDLEDFRLFISGIDKDKVSDLTTNIIRGHLVKYTQEQCALWGIELQRDMDTGFYWDRTTSMWTNDTQPALVIDGRRILLVPKHVVSYATKYTPQKYYRDFVLEYYRHEHLRLGTHLVKYRKKSKAPYVTVRSLKAAYPYSKDFLAAFTEQNPEVFREFKAWIGRTAQPLSNGELGSEETAAEVAAFLLDRLRGIVPGAESATVYHKTAAAILELLFYPDLVCPIVEREIHQGRKRIDLTFDNAAQTGFFHRLHAVNEIVSPFVFVECKNYSKEVANPELDQLSGRFSVNRGRFGLLLCRTVDDMNVLLQRCGDTYVDGRGVIIPLCDADLTTMLMRVMEGVADPSEELLTDRFRDIVLR